jgi:hypothetical protein
VNNDGPQNAQQASDTLPSPPAMPIVPSSEVYRGMPRLVLDGGVRYCLGWQRDRKAGPSFVVAKLSPRVKVIQRFPMTEEGWAQAWESLVGYDTAAAKAIAAHFAEREVRKRASDKLAALNAQSLCLMRRVRFNGGSGEMPLAKGQMYDLRFMSDRVMVCAPGSPEVILEMPYQDVETVDVSGSDSTRSGGDVVLATLGIGLLGALIGLLVLGLAGLILGALIFGMIGALVGSNWTKVETSIRLRGRDAEYYFVNTDKRPEALRIELSKPLIAIDKAGPVRQDGGDEPAKLAPEPVPDQLSRLGTLLQQGLITRDEFELLKARLIEQP